HRSSLLLYMYFPAGSLIASCRVIQSSGAPPCSLPKHLTKPLRCLALQLLGCRLLVVHDPFALTQHDRSLKKLLPLICLNLSISVSDQQSRSPSNPFRRT